MSGEAASTDSRPDSFGQRIEDEARGSRRRLVWAGAAMLTFLITAGVALVVPVIRADQPQPPVTTTTPPDEILSSDGPMFDFSDAPPLALENNAGQLVIQLPACLDGPVDRVALVSADLRSTLWELEALSARTDLRRFIVGEVPDGYREVESAEEPANLSGYIAVVNTPDALALSAPVRQPLEPGRTTLSTGAMEDFATRTPC